jgi:hypothetical protein
MRLIDQTNLPQTCDVFVLSEGAHRYRDALALSVLLQRLGPERDVHVWPILAPSANGGSDHYGLASEAAACLTHPARQSVNRSALVLGRVELFGPDMGITLTPSLQPELPMSMDDIPSPQPEYRELKVIYGRVKEYQLPPRTEGGSTSPYDYAVIYCGWQAVGRARRRLIILEGVSALVLRFTISAMVIRADSQQTSGRIGSQPDHHL